MATEGDIDVYIAKHEKFSEMLTELRRIIKKHPFAETIKWGMPTYVVDDKNLVGLGAFKNHVALWFFQGALLEDSAQILHNAQEGKTKAMRQIHFKTPEDINDVLLSSYLKETVDNQKKGLIVVVEKVEKKVVLPNELSTYLEKHPDMLNSFFNLTPGRQRAYAEYISSAKREKTKSERLVKITPLILDGKGLNDKYKR